MEPMSQFTAAHAFFFLLSERLVRRLSNGDRHVNDVGKLVSHAHLTTAQHLQPFMFGGYCRIIPSSLIPRIDKAVH